MMTRDPSIPNLDPRSRAKVALWRAASIELAIGSENSDPFVQAALHGVLAWLRGDIASAQDLLDAFGEPHGPLGPQLHFVGSLVHDPRSAWPIEPPRLWWWVVKAAYDRRWQELTGSDPRRRADAHRD